MFVEEVKEKLAERLPECEIELTEVKKINSVTLNGLVIKEHGSNIGVTVYPEIYEEYGESVDQAVEGIVETYYSHKVKDFDVSLLNQENINQNVIPILVNKYRNKDIVFKEVLNDLGIAYKYIVKRNAKGIHSITLTKEAVEQLGLDMEAVHTAAMKCMETEGKAVSLATALLEAQTGCELDDIGGFPLYMVSNKNRYYGAIQMLNSKVMNEALDKLNVDEALVIPNSIHECLVCGIDMSADDMKEMNILTNNKMREDEILSYSMYKYSREKGLEVYNG